MRPRRALLFSGLVLVTGSSQLWSRKNLPEVIYPTTQDQQSLEDLFAKPVPREPPPEPALETLRKTPARLAQPLPPAESAVEPAVEPAIRPGDIYNAGTVDDAVPAPVAAKPRSTAPLQTKPTYKVWIWQENGDTLWRIAQKVYGDKDKWHLIYDANRDVIKDPNKIYPRQVLKIPVIEGQP